MMNVNAMNINTSNNVLSTNESSNTLNNLNAFNSVFSTMKNYSDLHSIKHSTLETAILIFLNFDKKNTKFLTSKNKNIIGSICLSVSSFYLEKDNHMFCPSLCEQIFDINKQESQLYFSTVLESIKSLKFRM